MSHFVLASVPAGEAASTAGHGAYKRACNNAVENYSTVRGKRGENLPSWRGIMSFLVL
jgi:hypothetical protein